MHDTPAAQSVIQLLQEHQIQFRSVESCTGGMVFSALTAISGASAVLDRGFVTYSNQAKMDLVGVQHTTLSRFGAVSEETAIEMAQGGLIGSQTTTVCVAITGIAGPSGGSPDKPVGLVHIASALDYCDKRELRLIHQRFVFSGDRQSIRQSAANEALEMVIKLVETPS